MTQVTTSNLRHEDSIPLHSLNRMRLESAPETMALRRTRVVSEVINSSQKGRRGERACRDCFREAGFLKARRTEQYAGNTGEASDVTIPEIPSVHIEVKNTEAKNFLDWLDQAERDTKENGKIPIVMHKRKNRDWIAILRGRDQIEILRRSDLVES